jgi:hypothetical protein
VIGCVTFLAIDQESFPFVLAASNSTLPGEAKLSMDLRSHQPLEIESERKSEFSKDERILLCVQTSFSNESLTSSIPINVVVFKKGEKETVFNSSRYINADSGLCPPSNTFNIYGIISTGDYVVRSEIIGTQIYSEILISIENGWIFYLKHQLLTFQNIKILISMLAFFLMIIYVLWTVIKGHPPRFWVKHLDPSESRFELELTGTILMSIMVFSTVSFLANVNQPIGSNTSFGIVKDADVDNIDNGTRQAIKEEWVLNIGGTERIACVETNSSLAGPSLAYFKNRDYCYQTGKNVFQYSVVQGGIQIPLYVLILAFIGGYLRYLYNIAKTQIRKYRQRKLTKKPLEKDKELNESMRNFIQEFFHILLSPIVAIAVWLFLRQGGIESSLSLALSSITIGLILKNIIQTLESWAKSQLKTNNGEDGKNDGDEEDGKNDGDGDESSADSTKKLEIREDRKKAK